MAPSTEPVQVTPPTANGEIDAQSTRVDSKNGTVLVSTASVPGELNASLATVTINPSPKTVPTAEAAFASRKTLCTDHMVTARWSAEAGWEAPEIVPYGPLSIMPVSNFIHYATTCFEGMKLYRGYDGKLRLFRPDKNCERMNLSANRIALPTFPPLELLKLVAKLCRLDGPKWLPKDEPGRILYLRPTLIGDDATLGVEQPKEALLFVSLSMMPSTLDVKGGIKLLASDLENTGVRAWPGGHGWAKVGANYGPTLVTQGEARKGGFTQVLWLLQRDDGRIEVTEAGASNFFVIWRNRAGEIEMVTAPLGEKIILDGVTRRSVLQFAREKLESPEQNDVEPLRVLERSIEMKDIVEAVEEGRMIEAFAAGTAMFVAPVSMIRYAGKDLHIPVADGNVGVYARLLKGWLQDIMFGKVRHEWGYVIEEDGEDDA